MASSIVKGLGNLAENIGEGAISLFTEPSGGSITPPPKPKPIPPAPTAVDPRVIAARKVRASRLRAAAAGGARGVSKQGQSNSLITGKPKSAGSGSLLGV